MHPLGIVVLKTAAIIIFLLGFSAANARLLFQHFGGGAITTAWIDPAGNAWVDPAGNRWAPP